MNKISFLLESTDYSIPLGFEAWIDDRLIHDTNWVDTAQEVNLEISDNEANHVLKLVLKNKLPEHTQIDENGNIISDAMLSVSNFNFDNIPLNMILITNCSTYQHNFNNTKETTSNKFYGNLGCNGLVEIKFATPLYIWLLENM